MAKKFCITFQRTAYVDYVIEAEDDIEAMHEAYELVGTILLDNEFGKRGYSTEIAEVYEFDEDNELVPGTFYDMVF